MTVWTLWYPHYWVSGAVKAVTAMVSVYAALVLVKLLPKALEILSTVQLEATNQKLQQQIIERQRVEAALRDSERRFRAIFDQTFQFIGLLQPDGTLLEINRTALNFGGLTHADVINRSFWETRWWTISPQIQNRLKTAIAQAACGQFVRYEVELRGAEDTQAMVDFSLKPVFDEAGQVVILIAEGRDISAVYYELHLRKQAEAALRKAHDELEIRVQERTTELLEANEALQAEITERQRIESQLRNTTTLQRAILNSANYTIISTTPEGIIQTFNAAAERWLGYAAHEVVGKTTPAIIHDWDEIVKVAKELSQELGVTIEPGFEVFVAKARSGQIEEREWTYIRKDGSHFPVLLSVTALRDAENNITGFLGIGSDISDRKAAQEALLQSEHRYATLAKAAPVGIFRTDAFGHCIFLNKQACEIIGTIPEELVEEGWIKFLHHEDRQRVIRQWHQTIQQKLPFKSEHRFRNSRGKTTWVLAQAIAEIGTVGEVTGFIGTITDISDRKRSEEALSHSEATLRSFFDSAPMLMGVVEVIDDDILHISDNAAAAKFYGLTPALMQNRLASELGAPPNYIHQWIENYHEAERSHSPVRFEYTHDTLTGKRWLSATVSAISSDRSSHPRFSYIVEDISERKQSEEELQKQAFLLDLTHDTIIVRDANARITFWNRGAEEMYGWAKAEAIGQISHEFLQTQFPQPFAEIEAQLLQTGRWEGELIHIKRDGTPIVVDSRWALQRDEQGRSQRMLEMNNDITERKRAEEELRHLSLALESAVEGISQLDTQGRYLKVNPAYANAVGYQPEEMIGMEWVLTVHPEDLEKLNAAYQLMLTNGKVEAEARGVRKDKSVFDKQVVMVKAYDQQQQFMGHYCFMKDISDRREIERLKDEFVSVVSHELRTPLTSISGALDLLAGEVLLAEPEEAQRMLNIAASNTDRLVRLINDILDIERIESGKVQMTPEICDAGDLMTESIEIVEEMAEQAEVTLSVLPLSAPIWADPDRIIQVFTNLLSNAIKFSPPGSTICLSGEVLAAKRIRFQVKDQGRGIPAEKLESVFERFGQVDASDSRQKGGTGLGLAICRSILQHHNGQIWVESTLGEGSSFFFTLPLLSEDETRQRNRENQENLSPSVLIPITASSASPLVIECDDDPSIRVVVQTMLERQGYRVMAAASGQEAVEQAKLYHPDAIILNLMMPGMDGWETLAILKQQPHTQNIPVIILSGLLPDAKKGLPQSVSDWIVKPPNPKLLCQALEKATATQNPCIKVLIVEDDLDLAQVLIALFNRHGITTFYAQTGREAIQISQNILPDLLVLDLGLPENDGFAVVDWLRQHQRLCQVPLIVYTARDLDESDRDRLKLGQTLFFTKGRITPQEFEQRVINLLNRMIGDHREVSQD
ncbi:MAG: PAS domain S-box protein [Aulosira sp. ZfuVER01]|nr:PAS domain S-box protein [Aulosira sp. ZfuVER01]MDZ8001288.1 PAS domain S-box protein [Aulosira sp. DedVER01a]MDZ8050945.1 PAS domain S-box protein [Aulosira sp. ZfuCHP01]